MTRRPLSDLSILKTSQGTLPVATSLRQEAPQPGSPVFHLFFSLALLWGRMAWRAGECVVRAVRPSIVNLEQSVKGSQISAPLPGGLPYLTLGERRNRLLSLFLSSHFLPQVLGLIPVNKPAIGSQDTLGPFHLSILYKSTDCLRSVVTFEPIVLLRPGSVLRTQRLST